MDLHAITRGNFYLLYKRKKQGKLQRSSDVKLTIENHLVDAQQASKHQVTNSKKTESSKLVIKENFKVENTGTLPRWAISGRKQISSETHDQTSATTRFLDNSRNARLKEIEEEMKQAARLQKNKLKKKKTEMKPFERTNEFESHITSTVPGKNKHPELLQMLPNNNLWISSDVLPPRPSTAPQRRKNHKKTINGGDRDVLVEETMDLYLSSPFYTSSTTTTKPKKKQDINKKNVIMTSLEADAGCGCSSCVSIAHDTVAIMRDVSSYLRSVRSSCQSLKLRASLPASRLRSMESQVSANRMQ
jgi:hypothetical protein